MSSDIDGRVYYDVRVYCEVCKKKTRFVFKAVQQGIEKDFPLYDCTVCRTTRTLNSLLKEIESD